MGEMRRRISSIFKSFNFCMIALLLVSFDGVGDPGFEAGEAPVAKSFDEELGERIDLSSSFALLIVGSADVCDRYSRLSNV